MLEQDVEQVFQHKEHVKVIYDNEDEDPLCNVLSDCFWEGRICDVYRLLAMCKNNGIDAAYSLEYAFSFNWAMWHSRTWFDLLEFIHWLQQENIALPSATVMMLCHEGAPQLPDEEMANNVRLFGNESMEFSYGWETRIDSLLERGCIQTAIALALFIRRFVYPGSDTALYHLWYRVLLSDRLWEYWAELILQAEIPVKNPGFEPPDEPYHRFQQITTRVGLTAL